MNRWTEKAWFPWLLRGTLLALTLAAYLPSFRGAFVFDDVWSIVENDSLRAAAPFASPSGWASRPVVFLSLWLNFRLGQLDVVGYHVVNFLVHIVAGLTLFGLVRRTLRLPSGRLSQCRRADFSPPPTGVLAGRTVPFPTRTARWADLIAFVAALLWLIHPLQTQAVTYVIQRCESMMGMFYLLALYGVLRASQSPRPWPWYVAGVLAGWLGMGCKEVMITAPVVILLFDRIFLSGSWAAVFRRRWGFYLAWLPAVVWLVMVNVGRAPEVQSEWLNAPAPLEYLSSQPTILLHYLRLAVLPDRLCLDYQWPVMRDWSEIALPGLAMLGLFVASLVSLFRWPRVGFLAVSCFLILAPTSSINPICDLAVEHRMYLPLALLLTLAVLGFTAIFRRVLRLRRRRTIIYAVTLLGLAGMWGVRTFVRNLVYTKPDAVWANVLKSSPNNARAANNLGSCAMAAGEVGRAISLFQRCVELDPDCFMAYCNLARCYARKGDVAAGIAVVRNALQRTPAVPGLRCELGKLLEKQGRTSEAMAEYRQTLRLNPNNGHAHYRVGRILLKQGKLNEAIERLHAAEEERPNDVFCLLQLGVAYQRRGDFPGAMDYYRRVLDLEPAMEIARRNLDLCQAGKPDVGAASEEGATQAKKQGPVQPEGGRR